jgi:hypothetical protein
MPPRQNEVSAADPNRSEFYKSEYLLPIIGLIVSTWALSFVGPWVISNAQSTTDSAAYASGVFFVSAILKIALIVVISGFWRDAWSAIQDEKTAFKPSTARALILIPVVNIFGVFMVIGEFATKYHGFLDRNKATGKRLPEWFFMAAAVLPFLILAGT